MKHYIIKFKHNKTGLEFLGNGYGKNKTEAKENFLKLYPKDEVLEVMTFKNKK